MTLPACPKGSGAPCGYSIPALCPFIAPVSARTTETLHSYGTQPLLFQDPIFHCSTVVVVLPFLPLLVGLPHTLPPSSSGLNDRNLLQSTVNLQHTLCQKQASEEERHAPAIGPPIICRAAVLCYCRCCPCYSPRSSPPLSAAFSRPLSGRGVLNR